MVPGPVKPKIAKGPLREFFKAAVQKESDGMVSKGVWRDPTPEELRRIRKTIPCHLIYCIKRGIVAKCRLVADGSREEGGLACHYAPTPDAATFRCVMIYAARYNWFLWTGDVSQAFLNALLGEGGETEEVLLRLPAELGGKLVYCLKALYGLRGSPRAWNVHARKRLIALGWEESPRASGLFLFKNGEGELVGLLVLYVDDLVLVAQSRELKEKLAFNIMNSWEVKEIQPTNDKNGIKVLEYVGVEVNFKTNSEGGVSEVMMHSSARITKLLKDFEMESAKVRLTPAVNNHRTIWKERVLKADPTENYSGYEPDFELKSCIGALQYISTICRADIQEFFEYTPGKPFLSSLAAHTNCCLSNLILRWAHC